MPKRIENWLMRQCLLCVKICRYSIERPCLFLSYLDHCVHVSPLEFRCLGVLWVLPVQQINDLAGHFEIRDSSQPLHNYNCPRFKPASCKEIECADLCFLEEDLEVEWSLEIHLETVVPSKVPGHYFWCLTNRLKSAFSVELYQRMEGVLFGVLLYLTRNTPTCPNPNLQPPPFIVAGFSTRLS